MKKTLTLYLFLALYLVLPAQESYLSDSITTPNGRVYYKNGEWLGMNKLLELTKPYPEAHREMLKAKASKDAGTVFGLIGGFLVGWPIGTALAGGEPNWTLAVVGGAFVLISIPVGSGYKKHAMEGTRIYNREEFNQARRRTYWQFRASNNGFGIGLSF